MRLLMQNKCVVGGILPTRLIRLVCWGLSNRHVVNFSWSRLINPMGCIRTSIHYHLLELAVSVDVVVYPSDFDHVMRVRSRCDGGRIVIRDGICLLNVVITDCCG